MLRPSEPGPWLGVLNPRAEEDFSGTPGMVDTQQLSDDSGFFFFFDMEDDQEVVLKVLNGCSFNDRFWIFADGLTNVEFDLTVTDTQSGEVRSYGNPLGTPFEPIQDTQAFATCP